MGRRPTVSPHLKRIGAGAFEYDFGALDDSDDPLTKSYTDLMCDNLPVVRNLHRANHLPRPLALRRLGTTLDRSFSS